MKKSVLLLAVLMLVFAVALCACGEQKPVEQKSGEQAPVVDDESGEEYTDESGEETPAENVFDPADLDKLVVELNGATFMIDEKYEDVKKRLGSEVRPAQTYTPCGGSDDEQVTTHYYDGYELEETHDGIVYHAKISGIDNPDSKATVAGIKIGDTPDKVRSTFATKPDSDSEYTINYVFGKIFVSFGLDFEGTGNVNYISIDDFELAGA